MKISKENIAKKIKWGNIARAVVPVSYIYFGYLYISMLYGTVVLTFNTLLGYISYDLSNIHTFGDNIYYDSFFSMLSVIPASNIFIYLPIFMMLAIFITVYIISLFMKNKTLYIASILLSLLLNFFMIYCTLGQVNLMNTVLILFTLYDFCLAVYEIYRRRKIKKMIKNYKN